MQFKRSQHKSRGESQTLEREGKGEQPRRENCHGSGLGVRSAEPGRSREEVEEPALQFRQGLRHGQLELRHFRRHHTRLREPVARRFQLLGLRLRRHRFREDPHHAGARGQVRGHFPDRGSVVRASEESVRRRGGGNGAFVRGDLQRGREGLAEPRSEGANSRVGCRS